ncbi:DUF3592 domain-containing protein [Halomonas denitrificans]|nr:DUF3592 domain-containing protein [Halomonas denitrificans]
MNSLPFWFGAVFVLVGTMALIRAVRNLGLAERSRTWPTVPGRIESVRLWGGRRIDGEMREVEHLAVDFRYSFRGRTHRGTAPALYTVVYPRTVEWARRFEAGAGVDVHVDPDRPDRAVLVPGPHPEKPYSDVVLAASGLMLGLALVASAWVGLLT